MVSRLKLKELEKYTIGTTLGSFGKIRLIFRWNKFMNKYIIGAELMNGEPVFYGQTLHKDFDLFKPYRNKNVPKGTLKLIGNSGVEHSECLDLTNSSKFSLYYEEN